MDALLSLGDAKGELEKAIGCLVLGGFWRGRSSRQALAVRHNPRMRGKGPAIEVFLGSGALGPELEARWRWHGM